LIEPKYHLNDVFRNLSAVLFLWHNLPNIEAVINVKMPQAID